ncbi:MAG: hypothetical protein M1840_000543 [Geoglossum simile]|nr:MAG: hypothetical protein M1840_000543 [Geoglossum simile]
MGSKNRRSFSGRGGSAPQEGINLDLAVVPFTVVYKGNLQKARRRRSTTKYTPRRASRVASQSVDPPPAPVVEPHEGWEALKQRSSFMINQERFRVGHNVFVNHSNVAQGTELHDADLRKFWAAEVLEIRANDAEHVYLRVVWYYWPEELPGGKRYYHGRKEFVASNHMEIIHATTVAGRAAIYHWEENDRPEELEGYFWRQRFDATTRKLTPVQVYCVCGRAHNPDEVMVGCANPSCLKWLHGECVIKDVLRAAGNQYQPTPVTAHTSTTSPTTTTVYDEVMTPSPSPTKSDAEAAASFALPRRAITAEKLTTKPQKLTIDTSTALIPTTPVSPHIEGRIKDGAHGLYVVVAEIPKEKANGSSDIMMGGTDGKEDGDQRKGALWEKEIHCLSCGMVIK